jgi:tetrahydromethanopterin S-methyltransferase subunit G
MAEIDERVARIEGSLKQMDKRLGSVETDLRGIRTEIQGIRSEIGTHFRWMVGLMIGIWSTVVLMWVSVIVTVFLKVK